MCPITLYRDNHIFCKTYAEKLLFKYAKLVFGCSAVLPLNFPFDSIKLFKSKGVGNKLFVQLSLSSYSLLVFNSEPFQLMKILKQIK